MTFILRGICMITTYTEAQLNAITNRIIASAIAVHRALGPGLQENVYHNAMTLEFHARLLRFETEKRLQVHYREQLVGDFRLDLLVEDCIVVELKCVASHNPLFEAQLLNYMHIGQYPLGLLINFNHVLLKNGIKRLRL